MATTALDGGDLRGGGDSQSGLQFDSHLDRGEIARLFLLSESALDREICREISLRPLSFQLGFLRALMEAEGLSGLQVLAFLKKYIELKGRLLKIPGRAAAGLVRQRLPDGGREFCENMGYCKGKAEIRKKFDDLAGLEDEAGLAAATALEKLKEYIPDILEFAKESLDALSDFLGDWIIPGAFLIKVVKYGLDDFCPCCEVCDGLGEIAEATCRRCKGSGLKTPFPA